MRTKTIILLSLLTFSLLFMSCGEKKKGEVSTPGSNLQRTGGICNNVQVMHRPQGEVVDKSWRAVNTTYDDNMDGGMDYLDYVEAVSHNSKGDVTTENVFMDFGADGSFEDKFQFNISFTYDINGLISQEIATIPNDPFWMRMTYTRTATGKVSTMVIEDNRAGLRLIATITYTYDAQNSLLTMAYRGRTGSILDEVRTPIYTSGVQTSSQIVSTSNYRGNHFYIESYSYDFQSRLTVRSLKEYASAAFVTLLNEEAFTTIYCIPAAPMVKGSLKFTGNQSRQELRFRDRIIRDKMQIGPHSRQAR